MKTTDLTPLKNELSLKAKNGIDFIFSAALVWFAISFIWSLDYTSYNKAILAFMIGGTMLPLALGLSKVLKTNWKVKHNPLQPLGLWLNFAQLFYFPFLIFVLLVLPDYFIMAYAIITGAHFFPYAWLYRAKIYAITAGFISIGSFVLALNLANENMYYIPLFTAILLVITGISLVINLRKKEMASN